MCSGVVEDVTLGIDRFQEQYEELRSQLFQEHDPPAVSKEAQAT